MNFITKSYIENVINWDRIYNLIPGQYYLRGSYEKVFHDLLKNYICEKLQEIEKPFEWTETDKILNSNNFFDSNLEPFVKEFSRLISSPEIKTKINKEIENQLLDWLPYLKSEKTIEKALASSVPLLKIEKVVRIIKNVFLAEETYLNNKSSYLAYLTFVASGIWSDLLKPSLQIPLGKELISLKIKLRFPLLDKWIKKIKSACRFQIQKIKASASGINKLKNRPKYSKGPKISEKIWFSPLIRNKNAYNYSKLLSALVFLQDHNPEGAINQIGKKKIEKKLINVAHELRTLKAHTESLAIIRFVSCWTKQYDITKILMEIGENAFYANLFDVAEAAFRLAIIKGDKNPVCWKSLGLTLLASGRVKEAELILQVCVDKYPFFGMSHQNLAAKYDYSSYVPQPLDISGTPDAQLYDAYQLIGEYQIHVGEGKKALKFFGQALKSQRRLAKKFVIPNEIHQILEKNYQIKNQESIRILPYEWVTQIGHIAMLDTYRKLQLLGKKEQHCNILLAPKDKVANSAFLELWKDHFTIIQRPDHIQMIFPYQRLFGECFNAFLDSDGIARCWTELGAEAHVEWDQNRGESIVSISKAIQEGGKCILKKWGIKESSWFVALHVRGEGFHREEKNSMQSHRNASINDYLGAIHAITSRGGVVIRMGDPSMPKMPLIEGLVDYAHSSDRSEWMDVFLISSARFFLGTTSGLSNAVISVGTPCLLVNCISNYFQLWNKRVKFTLKTLWNEKERRTILLSEMLKNNFRSKLFNIHALGRQGLYPRSNTYEEVTAAVLEMLDDLKISGDLPQSTADHALKKACVNAGNEKFFGNGRISQTFYNSNQHWIR